MDGPRPNWHISGPELAWFDLDPSEFVERARADEDDFPGLSERLASRLYRVPRSPALPLGLTGQAPRPNSRMIAGLSCWVGYARAASNLPLARSITHQWRHGRTC
jgi:hypothetical protein